MTAPFPDPAAPPSPADLAAALGPTAPLWSRLVTAVAERHPPIVEAPSFSKASGWTVRLVRDGRILLYLIPERGSFLAGVVVGDKALAAARPQLPEALAAALDATKKHAEGRGLRWPVATEVDVDGLVVLVDAKLATT